MATSRSRALKSAWENSSLKKAMLDELMPADFYEVKQEVTPKAPPKAMWTMAAAVYLPTFVVFLALVVQGTGDTSTQTKITTKDISDGEWDCSMISKVGARAKSCDINKTSASLPWAATWGGGAPSPSILKTTTMLASQPSCLTGCPIIYPS